MRKRGFVFILVVCVAAIFFLFLKPIRQTSPGTVVQVGQAQYRVDVMDNEAERSQGLSGRSDLGSDEGMLFLFPTVGFHTFWMKDMHFPLDFVWIRDDRVIGLTDHVPPPESSSASLPTYKPPEPVDAALEINAGQIATQGIKIGDSVTLK